MTQISLPDPTFSPRWLKLRDWHSDWVPKIFKEMDRVYRSPGWNPKIVPLSGSTVMIDLVMVRGTKWVHQPYAIKVLEYEDHPFLKELPSNAPRAVKAIYRKTNRMKYARMEEIWPFWADLTAAKEAWSRYLYGITKGSKVR